MIRINAIPDERRRELDKFCAINVMGYKWTDHPDDWTPIRVVQCCDYYRGRLLVSDPFQMVTQAEPVKNHWQHSWRFFSPTTDARDAFAVLVACYNADKNSYLASLHNFLIRKEHDRSLTPLQICLFAKEHWTDLNSRGLWQFPQNQ